MTVDANGNATVDLTFKDDSEKGKSRFGVFLKFKDTNNNVLSVMTRMAGSGSINLQQLALGIEVVVLLLLKQDQQTVSLSLSSQTVS